MFLHGMSMDFNPEEMQKDVWPISDQNKWDGTKKQLKSFNETKGHVFKARRSWT